MCLSDPSSISGGYWHELLVQKVHTREEPQLGSSPLNQHLFFAMTNGPKSTYVFQIWTGLSMMMRAAVVWVAVCMDQRASMEQSGAHVANAVQPTSKHGS